MDWTKHIIHRLDLKAKDGLSDFVDDLKLRTTASNSLQ